MDIQLPTSIKSDNARSMYLTTKYLTNICATCGAEVYARWEWLSYSENPANESFKKAIKERVGLLKGEFFEKCPLCGGRYFSSYPQEFSLHDFKGKFPNESELDALFHYYRDRTANRESHLNEQGKAYLAVKRANAAAELKPKRDVAEIVEELGMLYGTNFAISSQTIKKALSTEKLKNYLMCLIQLETDIISSTEYLESLFYQHYFSDLQLRASAVEKNAEKKSNYLQYTQSYNAAKKRLEKIQSEGPASVEYDDDVYPDAPTIPQYKTPGLFNWKKIDAENNALREQYLKELKAYEKLCEKISRDREKDYLTRKNRAQSQYKKKLQAVQKELQNIEEQLDSLNTKSVEWNTPIKNEAASLIEKKIIEAKEILEKQYKTRSEMYSLNIVFGKYRNLVALTTFYEYLISGRCSFLEGAHGAYNIYEAEIRSNKIISQLSEIRNSLDSIQNTQYTICTQIQDINQRTAHLAKSMDAACNALLEIKQSSANTERNSALIAFNTAEAAYYAKVNANLTNALGFMVALK